MIRRLLTRLRRPSVAPVVVDVGIEDATSLRARQDAVAAGYVYDNDLKPCWTGITLPVVPPVVDEVAARRRRVAVERARARKEKVR